MIYYTMLSFFGRNDKEQFFLPVGAGRGAGQVSIRRVVMTTTPPAVQPVPLVWTDLTSRPRPAPDATVRYGDDRLQVVDLWLPADRSAAPRPVVLMIHGGCWQSSIADRRLMDWVADDLRSAGIAVWNIDYRGVDRDGGGYPGTFHDVAAAADLLRDTGATHGLDATRVVAVGHSAGGHLALWLAARARLPSDSVLRTPDPLPVRHVVSLGGLPDLADVEASPENGCGTDVIAQLVGEGRDDRFADTSIPRLLPLCVPQTLVNGREDRIVPYRMATDYVALARAAGDPVDLHTVADTGHVELVAPETPAWAEAKRRIAAALDRS